MLKSVGLLTEIHGAMIAITIMNPTSARPKRDFGFDRSSASHPGRCTPPPGRGAATLSGTASTSATVGWSCDMSVRAHSRIEDQVEEIHDEVRGDHTEREDEQQR